MFEESMEKKSDILRIVKEDILEALERKNGESLLSFIEPEIRVSRSFVSKAIRELEKEGLIQIKKRLVCLTKSGTKKAKDVAKKHFVLEDYFKKTRSKREAYKAASVLEHYVSMAVINNIKRLSILKKEGVPLTEFEQKEGLITDIIFNVKLFERIVSMGIFPGKKVKITNKLPDSIIVEIENKKFALAKKIAEGIEVLKI